MGVYGGPFAVPFLSHVVLSLSLRFLWSGSKPRQYLLESQSLEPKSPKTGGEERGSCSFSFSLLRPSLVMRFKHRPPANEVIFNKKMESHGKTKRNSVPAEEVIYRAAGGAKRESPVAVSLLCSCPSVPPFVG